MVEQWKKIMVHKNARQQSTGSLSSSRNIPEFWLIKKKWKKDQQKPKMEIKWSNCKRTISILMHRSDLDGSILLAKNRTDHPGPRWEEILTEFTYVFTPLSLHQFFR